MTLIDTVQSRWQLATEFARMPDIVVSSEEQPRPESRDLFDRYFELRTAAGYMEKPEGEELAIIQKDVRGWLEDQYPDLNSPGSVTDYRKYSMDAVNEKIGGLVDFLTTRHADKISGFERDATTAFIESTFAMYADKDADNLDDRDGSYAFVVPARMSRRYPMYGQEVEPVIPALRYVPNELRAWIMRECPPFVIDTYKPDETGRRGYLVYAPVTEDMRADLSAESAGTFVVAARDAVNDAVDFAHNRLGVRVVGLGATLPAVTHYGDSVREKHGDDLVVTTGHGGTAVLICKTIDALTENKPGRIGVLGLGAIGASTAEIVTSMYEGEVNIFDSARSKATRLSEKHPDRFTVAADVAEVFRNSDVIVSAVTSAIDFEKAGIDDLEGKLIVDDSQPASCHPKEVRKRGGTVVWVIGKDESGNVLRTGYDYGTMVGPRTDLFGCEAEAATLERHWQELLAKGVAPERAAKVVGRLAITGPVTALKSGRIGRIFDRYGISIAEPQAFGQRVSISA